VINGQQSTLDINEVNIVTRSANWRQEFLAVVGNPSFAYILMLLGIYGFIFEFSNSGGGVFGIVDNSTKSNTRKDNTVSALQALDLNFGTS
jgi:membrane-bound ClpP family serine protease